MSEQLLRPKLENIISGHNINQDDADWLRAAIAKPAEGGEIVYVDGSSFRKVMNGSNLFVAMSTKQDKWADTPITIGTTPPASQPGADIMSIYPTELIAKAEFELRTFERVSRETGNQLLAEVKEYRASQEQAEPAAQVAVSIERKVYKDSDEHSEYLSARFDQKYRTGVSFEWQGHRWAYRHTSFDDKGDYDLLWRPATTPQPATASAELPDLISQMTTIIETENKYLFNGGDTYMVARIAAEKCAALAAKQERKPMTDAEMWALWNAQGIDDMNQQEAIVFARSVESAHGISEVQG